MRPTSVHPTPTPSNPRTLGYLGRALSLELSAVQQYLTQASLCDQWGLGEAAERMRGEAMEELGHADRIIGHMLLLGVTANGSTLRPASAARTLVELLHQDARLESEIIGLYAEALAFSLSTGDRGSADLFQGLLADEVTHSRDIDTWLKTLEPLAGQPLARPQRRAPAAEPIQPTGARA